MKIWVAMIFTLIALAKLAYGQAELKLSWDHAVTNQLGFQAERVGNGESRLLEYGATQRSAIDSGLKKNTRYEYRLRALYDEGESEWTNWVKGKTGK